MLSFSVPKDYEEHVSTIASPRKSMTITSIAMKIIEANYDVVAMAPKIKAALVARFPSDCFSVVTTLDSKDILARELSLNLKL